MPCRHTSSAESVDKIARQVDFRLVSGRQAIRARRVQPWVGSQQRCIVNSMFADCQIGQPSTPA
jgi:hypothetical protein